MPRLYLPAMGCIHSRPTRLGLLVVALASLTGCDRLDRPSAGDDAVTLQELASHLGVRKYRVEVPAGLANPTVYLRHEELDEPEGGSFSASLRDMPAPSMLFHVDGDGRMAVSLNDAEGNARTSGSLGGFDAQGGSSTSMTRTAGPIASGDWIMIRGTDIDSEQLERDPPQAFRLYVLEQGQRPEDAGW